MSKKPRKTITYQEIKELDVDNLSKMTKSQLVDLTKKIREKTNIRISQLEKAKNTYSPAKTKLEENLKKISADKMSRNALIHEIAVHQAFHQSKTSTVEGARKVATQQDIMIFGAGKTGRPKHRMKAEQRTRFWSLYDEFLRTYANANARFGYQAIWQHLGEMQIKGKIKTKKEINADDLEELLRRLEIKEEEENGDYEYDSANVYSGKWYD